MAAAASAILTVKGLYIIAKDVYDRCKAVEGDFGNSKKRLLEQLQMTQATLQSYSKLEQESKIRFQEEWSSDLTPVGTAARVLQGRLQETEQCLEKFENKWKVQKFVGKTDIETEFSAFETTLHMASTELANAVQTLLIPGGKPKQTSSPIALMSSSEITEVEDLGRGGFGRVYLANHTDKGQVAVKEFFDQSSTKMALREAKKMFEGIDCQYLVNILGYIDEPKNVSIIMEYCENGNLKAFNRKFMMTSDEFMARKIRIIMDIAEGMNYMHTRPTPIFHSDLKLENVLVGGDFTAKIGDFGLAVSVYTVLPSQTKKRNNSHVPPEAYQGGQIDELYEIYTFAITLFEFLSGNDPWPDMIHDEVIKELVKTNKRPDEKEIPSYIPKEIIKIMKNCWNKNPQKRPKFKEILKQVSTIYQRYKGQLRKDDSELTMKVLPDILSGMKLEDKGDTAIVCKVMATRDYNSQSNTDLTFKRGDVIEIVEKTNSCLWRGKLGSARGYIPQLLVVPVQDIGEWEKEMDIKDKLRDPCGIALNPTNGEIAVADIRAKCVCLYSDKGKYNRLLDDTTHKLISPWGVVYTSGKYYVTDMSAYVMCYDADDGKYCDRWLSVNTDGKVNKYALLWGIAVTSDGNVLVGNNVRGNCYISKHTGDGKHVGSYKVGIEPAYLAVTSDDNVIISNGFSVHIVNQYDGSVLYNISHPDMSEPWGICCHGNVIFVCDYRSPYIYCFTESAEQLTKIHIDSQDGSRYLTMSHDGTKMLISRGRHSLGTQRVEIFSRKK